MGVMVQWQSGLLRASIVNLHQLAIRINIIFLLSWKKEKTREKINRLLAKTQLLDNL
jgi:hypothetical protein